MILKSAPDGVVDMSCDAAFRKGRRNDPGGRRRLTRDLAAKAWGHIQEVEELGGMAKAIEAGVPKLRIEEAAARTQARIDAGAQSVIGVNKYRPQSEAPALEANSAPRVVLRATEHGALEFCALEDLKRYAVDLA